MTSNYSTIEVKTENKRVKNVNITFNTFRIYTTLYYSYLLLYCKGHIQKTSNHNTIHVKTLNNRVNVSMTHSIDLLYYITVISYYIVRTNLDRK